jgi:hypothetical protein
MRLPRLLKPTCPHQSCPLHAIQYYFNPATYFRLTVDANTNTVGEERNTTDHTFRIIEFSQDYADPKHTHLWSLL